MRRSPIRIAARSSPDCWIVSRNVFADCSEIAVICRCSWTSIELSNCLLFVDFKLPPLACAQVRLLLLTFSPTLFLPTKKYIKNIPIYYDLFILICIIKISSILQLIISHFFSKNYIVIFLVYFEWLFSKLQPFILFLYLKNSSNLYIFCILKLNHKSTIAQ